MSDKQGLTLIVKTVTRTILAVIFLYGFYIILHGHLSPGGGFGGGGGLAGGGAFLLNVLGKGRLFDLWSAGFILPLNVIIGVKVGLALFLAVWALTEWIPDEGDDA